MAATDHSAAHDAGSGAGRGSDPVGDGGPAHETRDVDIRRVSILAGVLVLVIGAAMGLTALMFDRLAAREAGRQAPPSTLVEPPAMRLPPEPRLQEDPVAYLTLMRAEEQAALDGYGWVDRERGVAHIPVQRAMEILVRRGLPVRPQAPRAQGEDPAP